MSKQNKIIWRTLAVLVIALLVSLCFLGSTFARYTSEATATAAVKVASWDVAKDPNWTVSTTTVVTPSMEKFDQATYSSGYRRINTSEYIECLQVLNSGDVDAELESSTLVKGDIQYCDQAGDEVTIYDVDNSNITATNANAMFSYNLYIAVAYANMSSDQQTAATAGDYDTFTDASSGTTYYYILISEIDETDSTEAAELLVSANGGTLTIYAVVTWQTDTDNNLYGEAADALDTWIGKNVYQFMFTVTMNAVQASQMP